MDRPAMPRLFLHWSLLNHHSQDNDMSSVMTLLAKWSFVFSLCFFVLSDSRSAVAQVRSADETQQSQKREHFEKYIRPLFVRHCYECHSGASNEIKGGLRLDFREAVLKGGESGPALVPASPEESLLLSAVKHEGLEMPPGRNLSAAEITALEDWIATGAFDPRDAAPDTTDVARETFEAIYQDRRQWWSLQPIATHQPPVLEEARGLGEIDRFIVAKLKEHRLDLSPSADRQTLVRRAYFTVTGLPPTETQVTEFLSDTMPGAWERLIDQLLASPHFGERWARHWMDVVRYTDTYGYEWDMPAKGAWRYRDYLVRAFNDDIPFDQLIREQIAGDLMSSPRLNHTTGINESGIGPMFFQMGEKRHGDSAEFNGIHQEMLDNKIDAFGKAFLATTIACARCHDHKLDPISQRDYYAIGGLFMNARWVTKTVDLPERNSKLREQLQEIKGQLRAAMAQRWREDLLHVTEESLTALIEQTPNLPLEDPLYAWATIQTASAAGQAVAETWRSLSQQYAAESSRRITENAAHFSLVADFRDGIPEAWSVDGEGVREIVRRGDFVVALSGDKAIDTILPGGLCTNSLSPRMNGAVRTPLTRSFGAGHLSFEVAGGDFAARRTIVDNAFLTERQQYVADVLPKWQMVDGLGGMTDRHVYVEYATKTSNPNFPPRVGLGGACSEEQVADPRSWFHMTRVVKHVAPFSPHDELSQLLPLFANETIQSVSEAASQYRTQMLQAVVAWQEDRTEDNDVRWLNWMLSHRLVTNTAQENALPEQAALIARYRQLEQQLQEPTTVNGMADVDAPCDYRLNIRGDYDQLGDPVSHGSPRFLREICEQAVGDRTRLELAELVASPKNPLTARVYANRVWHWIFGTGLVATPDDFGHVGEKPSHPELLDYLAGQLIHDNWSTRRLIRAMLLSRTWQQSQQASPGALDADPMNRLWHHFPVRRLEAESIRDTMLAISGRLDARLFGPTSNPFRLNEDPQKRLFSGPLDGEGRRSIYTKVTIMEPPRFLATFNQPAPKIPTGRRDITTTPAQSLTLLNDPFVTSQAEYWATQLIQRPDSSLESRLQHMFSKAMSRDATSQELSLWADAARDFAANESIDEASRLTSLSLWQTMAHAMFNTKEFLYIR
jgi:hypothetical protein